MPRYQLIGLALVAALAGGCSDKAAGPVTILPRVVAPAAVSAVEPPAPLVRPAEPTDPAEKMMMPYLMSAVFAGGYDSATHGALVQFEEDGKSGEMPTWVITALAARTMPDDVTVLVTNADLADANGHAMGAHPGQGRLGVYLLKANGAGWTLLRRHDNVAELGEFGNVGRVAWVQLAAGKPGFVVTRESMAMGYGREFLSLFDPYADQMRDLSGKGIPVHAENTGACGPRTAKCWDVMGAWHLKPQQQPQQQEQPQSPQQSQPRPYDDIVMDFSGHISVGDSANATNDTTVIDRAVRKINGRARYAYDGQRYRLVSGKNQVPLTEE